MTDSRKGKTMITEGTAILTRDDGTYVLPGFGHVTKDYCPKIFAEVEEYRARNPGAFSPEPKPPEPTAEEKAARKAQEDEAKELALDMAWIRAERKKAKP